MKAALAVTMSVSILILIFIGYDLNPMDLPTSQPSEIHQTQSKIIISKVLRVYDGDTFYVNLKNLPDVFGKNIGIRIFGIDTPEIRGGTIVTKAMAQKAKSFLESYLLNPGNIELREVKRGKYFRLVARVYVDGEDIGQLLLDNDLAIPYFGGTKHKWN